MSLPMWLGAKLDFDNRKAGNLLSMENDFHVTLFQGSCRSYDVLRLPSLLKTIGSGIDNRVEIREVQVMGNPGNKHMCLMVNIDPGLLNLRSYLENDFGIVNDFSVFRPHISLGRCPDNAMVGDWFDYIGDICRIDGWEVIVDDVKKTVDF